MSRMLCKIVWQGGRPQAFAGTAHPIGCTGAIDLWGVETGKLWGIALTLLIVLY